MKYSADKQLAPPALIAAVVVWCARASACSVCFGAAGDPQTKGMNGAIFTLLGVTGFVALAVVYLVVRIALRSREAIKPAPVVETEPVGPPVEGALES